MGEGRLFSFGDVVGFGLDFADALLKFHEELVFPFRSVHGMFQLDNVKIL